MLEHVRGINGVHGVRRKWEPVSHVQPKIRFAERVAVYIHETWQVFWTAAQMQTGAAVPGASAQQISMQQVIGERSFRDAPKSDVFISLVKQPIPPTEWRDYSSHGSGMTGNLLFRSFTVRGQSGG